MRTVDAGADVASMPSAVTVQLNWKGKLRRRIEDGLSARLGHGLNWKGHAMEAIKRVMSLPLFPDSRAEWQPWAKRRLRELLDQYQPDVVISSHEPAMTIELGALARKNGYPWVADLGDPVLAPYTPRRWRKRALATERMLCARADLVTVTSDHAREVLRNRHKIGEERCAILTQGFDHREVVARDTSVSFDDGKLELLYTGSFYSFRRIGALLEAVLAVSSVRLSVATIIAPPELIAAARRHPDRIRLLGFIPHSQAVALQRRCDVLVNLANENPVQVPGKFFEYLGSGTPILHIGGAENDFAARLLRHSGGGWCEPDDPALLQSRLASLAEGKARDGKVPSVAGTDFDVMQYSWKNLSQRLVELISSRMPATAEVAANPLTNDARTI
ncbi:glycosyltransferase [Agrilutibacter terrestris]